MARPPLQPILVRPTLGLTSTQTHQQLSVDTRNSPHFTKSPPAVFRADLGADFAVELALGRTMHIPDSSLFAADLAQVLAEHSDEPIEILFVDDVLAWCSERKGECNGNPTAMAIRDSVTGQAGILIRRDIDADRIDGIHGRLLFGGFESRAARLDTPESFLRHLVLHELAHLANDWAQDAEEDCDEWAFRRMGL
jgi:hypothetical protein